MKTRIIIFALLLTTIQCQTSLGEYLLSDTKTALKINKPIKDTYLISDWNAKLQTTYTFQNDYSQGFLSPVTNANPEKSRISVNCDSNGCTAGTLIFDEKKARWAFREYKYTSRSFRKTQDFLLPDNEQFAKSIKLTEFKTIGEYYVYSGYAPGQNDVVDVYYGKIKRGAEEPFSEGFVVKQVKFGKIGFSSGELKTRVYGDKDNGYKVLMYFGLVDAEDRTKYNEQSVENNHVAVGWQTQGNETKFVDYDLSAAKNLDKMHIQSAYLTLDEGKTELTFTEFYQNKAALGSAELKDDGTIVHSQGQEFDKSLLINEKSEKLGIISAKLDFSQLEEKKYSILSYSENQIKLTGVGYGSKIEIRGDSIRIFSKSDGSVGTSMWVPVFKNGDNQKLGYPVFVDESITLEGSYPEGAVFKMIVNSGGMITLSNEVADERALNLDTTNSEIGLNSISLITAEDLQKKEEFQYKIIDTSKVFDVTEKTVGRLVEGGVSTPQAGYPVQFSETMFRLDSVKLNDAPFQGAKLSNELNLSPLSSVTGTANIQSIVKQFITDTKLLSIEPNQIRIFEDKKESLKVELQHPVKKLLDIKYTEFYLVVLYQSIAGRVVCSEFDLPSGFSTTKTFIVSSPVGFVHLVQPAKPAEGAKLTVYQQKAQEIGVSWVLIGFVKDSSSFDKLKVFGKSIEEFGDFTLLENLSFFTETGLPFALPVPSEMEIVDLQASKSSQTQGPLIRSILLDKSSGSSLIYSNALDLSSNSWQFTSPALNGVYYLGADADSSNYYMRLIGENYFFGANAQSNLYSVNLNKPEKVISYNLRQCGVQVYKLRFSIQGNLPHTFDENFNRVCLLKPAASSLLQRISTFFVQGKGLPPKQSFVSKTPSGLSLLALEYEVLQPDTAMYTQLTHSSRSPVAIANLEAGPAGEKGDQPFLAKYSFKPNFSIEVMMKNVKNSISVRLDKSVFKKLKKKKLEPSTMDPIDGFAGLEGRVVSAMVIPETDDKNATFKVTGGLSVSNSLEEKLGYFGDEEGELQKVVATSDFSFESNFTGYILVNAISEGKSNFHIIVYMKKRSSHMKFKPKEQCGEYISSSLRIIDNTMVYVAICSDQLIIGWIELGETPAPLDSFVAKLDEGSMDLAKFQKFSISASAQEKIVDLVGLNLDKGVYQRFLVELAATPKITKFDDAKLNENAINSIITTGTLNDYALVQGTTKSSKTNNTASYYRVLKLKDNSLTELILDEAYRAPIKQGVCTANAETSTLDCYCATYDSFISHFTINFYGDATSPTKQAIVTGRTMDFESNKHLQTAFKLEFTAEKLKSSKFLTPLVSSPADIDGMSNYFNGEIQPIFLTSFGQAGSGVTTAKFYSPRTTNTQEFKFSEVQLRCEYVKSYRFDNPQLEVVGVDGSSVVVEISNWYRMILLKLWMVISGIALLVVCICGAVMKVLVKKFNEESKDHEDLEDEYANHEQLSFHMNRQEQREEEEKRYGNVEDFDLRARGESKI